jgi:hypothetical protein
MKTRKNKFSSIEKILLTKLVPVDYNNIEGRNMIYG